MPQAETLCAALHLPVTGEEIASEFVFLPEGEHEVSALVNGKPGKRKVKVGPDSLEPLQASLSSRLSKNVRPFCGYDHAEGKASFIPQSFSYAAGRGVIVHGEWTKSGKEAVSGKDYSYFSPTFYRDPKTGKVLGLLPHGEIGSLVNQPAFESIERIAASHQELSDMETEEIIAGLQKLQLVSAEQAELSKESVGKLIEVVSASLASLTETAVTAAVAEATKEAPEKSELEQKVIKLEADNKNLKETLSAKRASDAELAIAEAVSAGRIAPQDEDAKSFWKGLLEADDTDKTRKQLAKLPVPEALKAKRINAEEGDKNEPKGLDKAIAAHKADA